MAPGGDPAGPRYDGLAPATLLGAGPGLTPSGDDVLAGALVAAHATGDPRLAGWAGATRAALTATRTTPVSRGMLHHAADGYATPAARRLRHRGLHRPRRRDGHAAAARRRPQLGAALLAGVVHTLTTYQLERSSVTKHLQVRRGSYVDSVTLMQVSRRVASLAGRPRALVAMATELNLDLAAGMGFEVPTGPPERDAGRASTRRPRTRSPPRWPRSDAR